MLVLTLNCRNGKKKVSTNLAAEPLRVGRKGELIVIVLVVYWSTFSCDSGCLAGSPVAPPCCPLLLAAYLVCRPRVGLSSLAEQKRRQQQQRQQQQQQQLPPSCLCPSPPATPHCTAHTLHCHLQQGCLRVCGSTQHKLTLGWKDIM